MANDREKARIREARFRERHRERLRQQSRERYQKIRATRGDCPICFKLDVKLYKDHSHSTGLQRQLICNNCNLILGHAKDDPGILRRAAEYLERHSGLSTTRIMVQRMDVDLASGGGS